MGMGTFPNFLFLSNDLFAYPQTQTKTQLVKNPPAMQEILVQSLGREDPLEKG